MDQLVVDLDGDDPGAGAEVALFGPGDDGEPTAQDWAEACGTISYEIVTRIGGRFTRRYVDSEHARRSTDERPPPHPRGRRRCRRPGRGRAAIGVGRQSRAIDRRERRRARRSGPCARGR